jgi:hypothetical protein
MIITGSRLVHFGKIADIPVSAISSKTVCLPAKTHSEWPSGVGKNIPQRLLLTKNCPRRDNLILVGRFQAKEPRLRVGSAVSAYV